MDTLFALAEQAKAGLHYMPMVVLRCVVAFFFGIMAKTSLFLFRAAADGALSQGSRRSNRAAESSYSLLGMPMMDMEVLKATQVVFTSVAIIISMFGAPIV